MHVERLHRGHLRRLAHGRDLFGGRSVRLQPVREWNLRGRNASQRHRLSVQRPVSLRPLRQRPVRGHHRRRTLQRRGTVSVRQLFERHLRGGDFPEWLGVRFQWPVRLGLVSPWPVRRRRRQRSVWVECAMFLGQLRERALCRRCSTQRCRLFGGWSVSGQRLRRRTVRGRDDRGRVHAERSVRFGELREWTMLDGHPSQWHRVFGQWGLSVREVHVRLLRRAGAQLRMHAERPVCFAAVREWSLLGGCGAQRLGMLDGRTVRLRELHRRVLRRPGDLFALHPQRPVFVQQLYERSLLPDSQLT
jgi:hypothetical protein